ncbi:hypothetical protein BHM03_00039195, partial [Ensete ventricosum]
LISQAITPHKPLFFPGRPSLLLLGQYGSLSCAPFCRLSFAAAAASVPFSTCGLLFLLGRCYGPGGFAILKASVESDPSGTLVSWNESSDLCRWSRVVCNGRSRVSTLDLHGLGLTGSVSPYVGNLSYLRFLYLQDNQLSGELPHQLGGLLHLEILNASSNLIAGAIPANLSRCSSLTTLDLSQNLISGSIPSHLELLSKLQVLKLGKNNLTGTIPSAIGNLSSLTTLNLGTNALGGSIPGDVGRLHALKDLQIAVNHLAGHVPPTLYNLSSLVFLDFASNFLFGEIPGDVGYRLPNLVNFHFCFNQFTGLIPPSLHNVTSIESLRFSHNFLHGPIPPGLGNLRNLVMYNIGFNQIVSSGADGLGFITSLTNSTRLQHLSIDGNLLEGVIPDSVGNLSSRLYKFYSDANRISGSIPASIGQLSSLALLTMSHNSISGGIPPEVGQLRQLRVLSLADNRLSGEIPAAIGNLTMLTELQLGGNQLEGSIPSTVGQLQQLQSLDASGNKLEGSIPKELFTISSLASLLNLSENSLSGPLPEGISDLANVVAIDLSGNMLSGNITPSIGNCRSLQILSMSNNSFSGPIPDAIGDLKGLRSIDLSLNQLSGPIPQSLGELEGLEFLNLSYNHLEGVVPSQGVFRNLSAVHLEGNTKLCWSSSACMNTRNRAKLPLFSIVIVTAFIVFLMATTICVFFVKTRRRTAKISTKPDSTRGQHPLISYEELHRATESFHPRNLVGTGSFGSVYKGVLGDGLQVAVKVLNLAAGGALKSFVAECDALRNARHRNLVKLITVCLSLDPRNEEFRALVYEFMGNGSLEEWIRGKRRHEDGSGLSLLERLDAAIDVASALDYLHNDCEVPVVHCDLKPSNVVLDSDMTAKVGDFGLAKVLVDMESTATHGLKGSIGYIPPAKGDVYSYGVMLLELITGKSPTDECFEGDLSLERWVRAAFPDELTRVLDAELTKASICHGGREISREKQDECLVSVTGVGLSCAKESPDARLTIREALSQLKGIRDGLLKLELAITI